MFMVSRLTASRPRLVKRTLRRAVFIWGVTEVIVPWTRSPGGLERLSALSSIFFSLSERRGWGGRKRESRGER